MLGEAQRTVDALHQREVALKNLQAEAQELETSAVSLRDAAKKLPAHKENSKINNLEKSLNKLSATLKSGLNAVALVPDRVKKALKNDKKKSAKVASQHSRSHSDTEVADVSQEVEYQDSLTRRMGKLSTAISKFDESDVPAESAEQLRKLKAKAAGYQQDIATPTQVSSAGSSPTAPSKIDEHQKKHKQDKKAKKEKKSAQDAFSDTEAERKKDQVKQTKQKEKDAEKKAENEAAVLEAAKLAGLATQPLRVSGPNLASTLGEAAILTAQSATFATSLEQQQEIAAAAKDLHNQAVIASGGRPLTATNATAMQYAVVQAAAVVPKRFYQTTAGKILLDVFITLGAIIAGFMLGAITGGLIGAAAGGSSTAVAGPGAILGAIIGAAVGTILGAVFGVTAAVSLVHNRNPFKFFQESKPEANDVIYSVPRYGDP